MLLRTFSAHVKVVARDAKEMRSTQDTRTECIAFQQMKNSFYLPFQLFENRRSMRMLLFLRLMDLTEYFIVKQKSILKHQKLLLQDVTLGSWVLKDPFIGKDQ